jgi:hypothetical protein
MLRSLFFCLVLAIAIPDSCFADCNPFNTGDNGCDGDSSSTSHDSSSTSQDGPSAYGECDSSKADCLQSADHAYDSCLDHCTTPACNDRCEKRVNERNDSCESAQKSCYQAKDAEAKSWSQLQPSGRISHFGQDNNSGWQKFNCIANGGTNC